MAIKQQEYNVMLELFDGTTGDKWTDPNPSSSILEEINVDIYKDGIFETSRNPDTRISDNLTMITLTGGSTGETDAGNVFLDITYTGSEDITIPSIQILLDDFNSAFDNISTAEPTGKASTFREMIVQTWMRFFNKVDKNDTQIKVYDKSDTVSTTQIHTTVGSTTTIEEAS